MKHYDCSTHGTEAHGNVEQHGEWPTGKPRWRGRVRLGDGTKSNYFDVPETMTEPQGRAWVAGIQADEDAQGLLLAAKKERERANAAAEGIAADGETADVSFSRYVSLHEKLGNAVKEHAGAWKRWCANVIGTSLWRALRAPTSKRSAMRSPRRG